MRPWDQFAYIKSYKNYYINYTELNEVINILSTMIQQQSRKKRYNNVNIDKGKLYQFYMTTATQSQSLVAVIV